MEREGERNGGRERERGGGRDSMEGERGREGSVEGRRVIRVEERYR